MTEYLILDQKAEGTFCGTCFGVIEGINFERTWNQNSHLSYDTNTNTKLLCTMLFFVNPVGNISEIHDGTPVFRNTKISSVTLLFVLLKCV